MASINSQPMVFDKWMGEGGMDEHIQRVTGCKAFTGAGINTRYEKKTAILKSVDDTHYYDDDMEDFNNPKYTLFGRIGDQSESETRFNAPLLNDEKIEHIYLYRVKMDGKKKVYLWYGKYDIVGKESKTHPDINGDSRKIIILNLKRATFNEGPPVAKRPERYDGETKSEYLVRVTK